MNGYYIDPQYTQEAADRRHANFQAFQERVRTEQTLNSIQQEPYNPAQYLVGGVDSQVDNNQREGGEVALLLVCALVALVVLGLAKLIQLGVRAGVRAYRAHQAAKTTAFDKQP
jgi:hypothetical protein